MFNPFRITRTQSLPADVNYTDTTEILQLVQKCFYRQNVPNVRIENTTLIFKRKWFNFFQSDMFGIVDSGSVAIDSDSRTLIYAFSTRQTALLILSWVILALTFKIWGSYGVVFVLAINTLTAYISYDQISKFMDNVSKEIDEQLYL